MGSGYVRLATTCAVTLRPVYTLSSVSLLLPALSSWKIHPPRPRLLAPFLGSLPRTSDLSLSFQNLMGVGASPVCTRLLHLDHEGLVLAFYPASELCGLARDQGCPSLAPAND